MDKQNLIRYRFKTKAVERYIRNKGGMMKYERLTGRTVNGTAVIDGAKEGEALKRLAELEDKIEQGTIIELPRIIHPTRHEWWVQYQESSGILHQFVCFSKDEAKTKLKELQE